jgi:hypothetical protein
MRYAVAEWRRLIPVAAVATTLLLVGLGSRPAGAQIEGTDLTWVNGTQCAMGFYFNKTGCACAEIRARCPNDCNGHGVCDYGTGACSCDIGWGSATDITEYKALDCSQRTCPSAVSWGGVATSPTTARAVRECSGVGLCNKLTGACACAPGYFGEACELAGCPNACSGHGRCVNNAEVCAEASVAPVGDVSATYGLEVASTVWDAERIHGCVCDSSWAVGTGIGELPVPEYYGADCSLRRCPSGNDPVTTRLDETDCSLNGTHPGALCYVPCSNRGACHPRTGECSCHVGFAGRACATRLTSTSRRQS